MFLYIVGAGTMIAKCVALFWCCGRVFFLEFINV